MGHVNFLNITYTILIIIVLCLLLSDKLMILFKSKYGMYFMWLYALTIAELIIIAIFIMYYQEITYKKGKRGLTGRAGKLGITGSHASCLKCKEMMGK